MSVPDYVDLCSSDEDEGAKIGLLRKLSQPQGEEEVIDLTPCTPSSLPPSAVKDRRKTVKFTKLSSSGFFFPHFLAMF